MSNLRRFMHLRRKNACTGKVKYKTAKEARKVAASMARRQGIEVLHYKCPFCGGYHCGHWPARVTMPAPVVAS